LEGIRKAGKTKIYELNEQQQGEWRTALLPVQKDMEGRIGKEIIDAIKKAAAMASK
jgi:C4-dicarboxylate-binding protein DctP